jgi:hypothetical protein
MQATGQSRCLIPNVGARASKQMDPTSVVFQLSEAREHLDELINELREGRLGDEPDIDLQFSLEHIIDHLCFAWNARDLSIREVAELTQEDFERCCQTVPDFFGNRTLQ